MARNDAVRSWLRVDRRPVTPDRLAADFLDWIDDNIGQPVAEDVRQALRDRVLDLIVMARRLDA